MARRLPHIRTLRRLPGVTFAGERDADAVVVCEPAADPVDLAADALDGGRHVYLDLPLPVLLAGAGRLASAAERSGAVAAVALTHRFDPVYERARALLREGIVGDLREVSTTCREPVRDEGAAALWQLGAHHIDLLTWLTGERLGAVSRVELDAGEAYLSARTDGGACFEAAFGPSAVRRCAWVFAGDDGLIAVDRRTGRITLARDDRPRRSRPRADALRARVRSLPIVRAEPAGSRAIAAWARRAAGGTGPALPGPRDAVDLAAALEAIEAVVPAAAV
jgi:predicted dehydrogenase